MRPYYQLIPEKVAEKLPNLEDLIRPEIKGFSPDCLKEVISIIAVHVRKDEGSTPLVMTYLKKLVPQGDKYLYWLMELGVVERSGYYEPGKSSYCYNFKDKYFSNYVSFTLDNAKLIYRLERVRESLTNKNQKITGGFAGQIKYLKKLTIEPEALEFIAANYTHDTNQFNNIFASAYRIMNGDISYKVDCTSGRFHSNVTNMARVLTPFLRVDGEPLVNVDVKNSQPYLSTILLTNPGKVSFLTQNHAFAMLLQSLKVYEKEDVKNYIRMAVSGELYECLMSEFEKDGLLLSRSATKEQVLRILFARNRMPKDGTNRLARQIFKRLFPTVYRIFNKIRGRERGDKFTSFKRFSILLQTIESHVMDQKVLKRINKELSCVIRLTKHDSIMTGLLTNKAEEVSRIMADEFEKFVGYTPKIKIEGNRLENREVKEGIQNTNQYDATNPVSFS